jgi:hypothetical protein
VTTLIKIDEVIAVDIYRRGAQNPIREGDSSNQEVRRVSELLGTDSRLTHGK